MTEKVRKREKEMKITFNLFIIKAASSYLFSNCDDNFSVFIFNGNCVCYPSTCMLQIYFATAIMRAIQRTITVLSLFLGVGWGHIVLKSTDSLPGQLMNKKEEVLARF